MKIALIAFLMAILMDITAQNYRQLYAGFGPYFQQSAGLRDPRSNRGPILFPPGPEPNRADTSGVIVGASGYGFVPPNTDNDTCKRVVSMKQLIAYFLNSHPGMGFIRNTGFCEGEKKNPERETLEEVRIRWSWISESAVSQTRLRVTLPFALPLRGTLSRLLLLLNLAEQDKILKICSPRRRGRGSMELEVFECHDTLI
ncbi:hypothetical protein V1478_010454 [Vespula squamosa]|uniref:Uncharacterized protein n=1 Tax=Vespula squamosa TaxID=30214 RepID=A0ABD2AHU1_VESSQ